MEDTGIGAMMTGITEGRGMVAGTGGSQRLCEAVAVALPPLEQRCIILTCLCCRKLAVARLYALVAVHVRMSVDCRTRVKALGSIWTYTWHGIWLAQPA